VIRFPRRNGQGPAAPAGDAQVVYASLAFRNELCARWGVFLSALPLAWEYQPAEIVLASGIRYQPDFYLPTWDVYFEVWPDFPHQWVTDDDIAVVYLRDTGHTPLGKFFLASHQLREVQGTCVRPRLHMLCGTPGVPRLRHWRGRWRLDGGAAVLHVMQAEVRLLLPIQAWSDNAAGRLDIWPFYLDGSAAAGMCPRETAHFPSGTMTSLYLGDGRSYATDRLVRGYRAARDARFGCKAKRP
jgi:hypothetical protein